MTTPPTELYQIILRQIEREAEAVPQFDITSATARETLAHNIAGNVAHAGEAWSGPMITSPKKAYSVHGSSQDAMQGVHVWYWEPVGRAVALYQCLEHGYFLEDNPHVCAHIKLVLVMHEKEGQV